MVTKKQMLMLGLVAIGGLALASQVAAPEGGVPQPRFGRILGTPGAEAIAPAAPAAPLAPTVYQIPAAGEVTFPATPTFDISQFLAPLTKVKKVSATGAKGVSRGYVPGEPFMFKEKPYVLGGPATLERQAKEVATLGYSPSLGAAFGLGTYSLPTESKETQIQKSKQVSMKKKISKPIRRVSAFTPSQKARVARHMAKVT